MTRWQKFRNWSADKRSKAWDMLVNNRVSLGIATLVGMLITGVKTLTVDLPVAGLSALGNTAYKGFSYVPGFTKAANAVSGFFAQVKARFTSNTTDVKDFESAAASATVDTAEVTAGAAANPTSDTAEVTAGASANSTSDTAEVTAGAAANPTSVEAATVTAASTALDTAEDATRAATSAPNVAATPASARASSGDLSAPQAAAAVTAKTPSPGRSTRVGRAAASLASGVKSAGKAMTHALDGVRGRPASNDSGKGSVATPTERAAASNANRPTNSR